MTVLIDSWVWIEYWRGGRQAKLAATYLEGDEEAFVSAVTVAETYHWILINEDEETAEAKRQVIEGRTFVVPLDADLAVQAAKIKREEKLALADSIVLATGRRLGVPVVSGDPDLEGKEGVTFIGAASKAPG